MLLLVLFHCVCTAKLVIQDHIKTARFIDVTQPVVQFVVTTDDNVYIHDEIINNSTKHNIIIIILRFIKRRRPWLQRCVIVMYPLTNRNDVRYLSDSHNVVAKLPMNC